MTVSEDDNVVTRADLHLLADVLKAAKDDTLCCREVPWHRNAGTIIEYHDAEAHACKHRRQRAPNMAPSEHEGDRVRADGFRIATAILIPCDHIRKKRRNAPFGYLSVIASF